MKLLSFKIAGEETYGAVVDGGVIDLKRATGNRYPDLKAVLAADALAEMEALIAGKVADYGLGEIEYLPVIPNPDKIFCIGINYGTHMMETSKVVPEAPIVFARFANSQIGHLQPFLAPPECASAWNSRPVSGVIGVQNPATS